MRRHEDSTSAGGTAGHALSAHLTRLRLSRRQSARTHTPPVPSTGSLFLFREHKVKRKIMEKLIKEDLCQMSVIRHKEQLLTATHTLKRFDRCQKILNMSLSGRGKSLYSQI